MGSSLDPAALDRLRHAVDDVDERIVALLAERFRLTERIAELKDPDAPVADKARSLDVLDRVETAAAAHGLPAGIAGPVWSVLIALSIGHQSACIARRRGPAASRPRASGPDQ